MKNLLWAVPENFVNIYHLIDEADGEITPEIEIELDKIEADAVGRAFSMKAILTTMKDKAAIAKQKKAEYAALQKVFENGEKTIKIWLLNFMDQIGKKELTYQAESIKKRKCPPSVEVLDEKEVPEQYKKYTVKLTCQQWRLLKENCEFLGIEIPESRVDIDKAGIKTEYKNSKLEVAGTQIKSGVTLTLKG